MPPDGVRIAMWSGPRNLSTALLRAWGSRPDTSVVDEPLYACWLARTGREHPGRAEILARHETDAARVVEALTGPVPDGRPIFYQKHMAHHLLADFEGPWLRRLRHAFLIRDPGEMLTSLTRVVSDPSLADTGLPRQVALWRSVARREGQPPPVVDARDLAAAPAAILRSLCAALGVPWDPRMLRWEPGPRPTDGVWGEHWYRSAWRSTGFEPPPPRREAPLPAPLRPLLEACRPLYDELHAARLRSELTPPP